MQAVSVCRCAAYKASDQSRNGLLDLATGKKDLIYGRAVSEQAECMIFEIFSDLPNRPTLINMFSFGYLPKVVVIRGSTDESVPVKPCSLCSHTHASRHGHLYFHVCFFIMKTSP